MEIKIIENKEVWENFLFDCENKSFLQSWNWGEFNKLLGNKIWHFGIYNNEKLISVALVIKICARRGTFLSVPHGPVVIKHKTCNMKQVLETIKNNLSELAKREKASFVRVSPIEERNEENIKMFRELGFRNAPIHLHPDLTWELDLKPSEEEILANMRKTTRYLIRQASKNSDIKIAKTQKIEEVELFNNIYQPTVNRHHFVPYSLDYLKNELLAFLPDNQIAIFLGKYKEEVIASSIIIFWSGIAVYHHGASSLKYPKIPVSYLLQWEAIKEAKKRGCKIYNFWGIVPTNNPKHPWTGFTLFKIGFGGYKKEYVRTQDLVVSPRYWLNYTIETIRRIKRHL